MIGKTSAIASTIFAASLVCMQPLAAHGQNAADNLVREFYAWYPCCEPTKAIALSRQNPWIPVAILNSARPERDRFAAFHCAVAAGFPGYKTIIVQAVRDRSERIRASAVHRLPQALEGDELVNSLVRLLDDPSNQVRHNSLEVMSRCPGNTALEKMFELAQHESIDMRHGAVSALLARNDEQARAHLRTLSQSAVVTISGPAAAALSHISSERFEFEAVAAYLRHQLLNPEGGMSKYLIDIMGRRGSKEAIAVLESAAKHPQQAIQESARNAVTQIELRAKMQFEDLIN